MREKQNGINEYITEEDIQSAKSGHSWFETFFEDTLKREVARTERFSLNVGFCVCFGMLCLTVISALFCYRLPRLAPCVVLCVLCVCFLFVGNRKR